jgi:hypothetical protein
MSITLSFTSLNTRLRQGLLTAKRVVRILLLLSVTGHGDSTSARQDALRVSEGHFFSLWCHARRLCC